MLNLSAETSNRLGQVGAIFPTYLLNPAEIHAAAHGIAVNPMRVANVGLIAAGRAELAFENVVENYFLQH